MATYYLLYPIIPITYSKLHETIKPSSGPQFKIFSSIITYVRSHGIQTATSQTDREFRWRAALRRVQSQGKSRIIVIIITWYLTGISSLFIPPAPPCPPFRVNPFPPELSTEAVYRPVADTPCTPHPNPSVSIGAMGYPCPPCVPFVVFIPTLRVTDLGAVLFRGGCRGRWRSTCSHLHD